MINPEINDLLIRSINEKLTAEEDKKLQDALKKSAELRDEKAKLIKVKELISSRSHKFSDGFHSRVMQAVSEEKKGRVLSVNFGRNLTSMFNRVAVAGVAVIILLVISLYLSHGSLDVNTITGVEPVSQDNLVSVLLYEK